MSREDFTLVDFLSTYKYDKESGIFTRLIKRGKHLANVSAGSENHGYVRIRFNGVAYQAHRLAWLVTYGEWPSSVIDHIDGNRSNNRIENLRNVSHTENMQNIKDKQWDNRVGILGVCKVGKKFRASICINSKPTHLGCFATAEMAGLAYLDAKRKFHAGCTI